MKLRKIQLSAGLPSNPRTWPILDGSVVVDGLELLPSIIFPSELFWRQLRFGDFDISEMSFSSLIKTIARGDDRWVGLPIFMTRRFFHTEMIARTDRGIQSPVDLKGKLVGVPEYQQTAALWTRGALQHEFGVSPKDMEFWMERVPDHSHAGATDFRPPSDVIINQIPLEKSIGSMMVDGELDAAVYYIWGKDNLIDRSKVNLLARDDMKSIFPDPHAEGVRYFQKTGIYPINHTMVIKRSLVEQHPWLPLNLLKLFEAANNLANTRRMQHVDYYFKAGFINAEAMDGLRKPLVEYGIKANRLTLETAAEYSFEQGLTDRLVGLEEVFAESTLEQ
ncbi:MAG: hypothetical protein ACO3N9_01195 [Alphaproteobacteria bacterium]